MSQGKIGRILRSVAKKMSADFEQSQVFQHRGETGTSRELIVHNFLNDYLPSHVAAIHNAEVISVDGGVSPQCDVVLVDKNTPPFTNLDGYRIIPNESVYGMVEVKSHLDKNSLTDACNKVSRMRRLQKSAYRPIAGTLPRSTTAYGRKWPHFPTSGMIIAFEGSDLKTRGTHLIEWCRGHNPIEWPDSIWVLGQGYLQWGDAQTRALRRSPQPGSVLHQIDAMEDTDILLPLALHLNIHFSDAWMDPLDLVPYSGTDPLGSYANEWTI